MKQINYFKFLEQYPEFIGVEEEESVKLVLLSAIKEKYWFKKEGEIARLLPIKFNYNMSVEDFRNKGYDKHFYNIKFKKYHIFAIGVIEKENDLRKNIPPYTKYPHLFFHIPFRSLFADKSHIGHDARFMSKEEITNLKREILIKEMIK